MILPQSISFHSRLKQLLALTFVLLGLTALTLILAPQQASTSIPLRVVDDYTTLASQCPPSDPPSTWRSWFSPPDRPQLLPDVIPQISIEGYIQAYLSDLTGNINATYLKEVHGLDLGDTHLRAYTADLEHSYAEYLSPLSSGDPELQVSQPPSWLSAVRARLSLRPPIRPLPPAPKQVITTDKSPDALPSEFDRWKEVMPKWDVRYFDDTELESWVDKHFAGSKAQSLWAQLPRKVLQTDVFRYMAMLVEGGIYTDSDTAPIIHADHWGRPYSDLTPPLLKHLTRILSLSTSSYLDVEHPASLSSHFSQHSGAIAFHDGLVSDGNEQGEPGLVISIEADALAFGWDDWRGKGMARAIQMTQWTFLARPGHPVFLDALGHAFREAEHIASSSREAESKGEVYAPPSTLEWTGPGVFTDCVYRYLVTRYGITPDDLSGQKEPIRIGDVLILPAGSFSSVSPFGEEPQRPWAATWHGFYGRWRGADPAVHQRGK